MLRHTFATHLLNNGADENSARTSRTHGSLSSTQNLYTCKLFNKITRPYFPKVKAGKSEFDASAFNKE